MRTDEFLYKVRERAGLSDNDEAEQATDAVLGTLRARLSKGTVDDIAERLPDELKDMWKTGFIERLQQSITGVERMDLSAFLAKIAADLDLESVQRAEDVTCAVFATFREAIPENARETIGDQLPDDIRSFWASCTPGMEQEKYEAEAGAVPGRTAAPGLPPDYLVRSEPMEEDITGPATGLPMGSDVEIEEAYMEAQVREMKYQQAEETGEGLEKEGPEPPAADRIEYAIPPEERTAGVEGPGSEVFYRSDVDLTHEIEDMLNESDEVDAAHIDVFVQAGNVTLRGTVKSEEERNTAAHLVSRGLGVGEIRNEITVSREA